MDQTGMAPRATPRQIYRISRIEEAPNVAPLLGSSDDFGKIVRVDAWR